MSYIIDTLPMGDGMAGGNAKTVAGTPRLWVLILAAQRETQRMLSEALRPLGITPAQGEVLTVLSSHPPLTLGALGERLVCETGSPSRLVSGLARLGWLRRTPAPDDGRAVRLALTEEGYRLATLCRAVTEELEAELLTLVETPGLDATMQTLWRLVSRLPAGRALKRRAGRA